MNNFSVTSWREQVTFRLDGNIRSDDLIYFVISTINMLQSSSNSEKGIVTYVFGSN